MGAWPSQQPPSIPTQQIRTPHAGIEGGWEDWEVMLMPNEPTFRLQVGPSSIAALLFSHPSLVAYRAASYVEPTVYILPFHSLFTSIIIAWGCSGSSTLHKLVNYFNQESFQGLFLDNRTSLEQLSC
jgi:hypothetical protein